MFNKELSEERLTICKSCEHLKGSPPVQICNICKCVMYLKTRLPQSYCPKGKWDKVKKEIL